MAKGYITDEKASRPWDSHLVLNAMGMNIFCMGGVIKVLIHQGVLIISIPFLFDFSYFLNSVFDQFVHFMICIYLRQLKDTTRGIAI